VRHSCAYYVCRAYSLPSPYALLFEDVLHSCAYYVCRAYSLPSIGCTTRVLTVLLYNVATSVNITHKCIAMDCIAGIKLLITKP
jgi:hypothetical protein